STQRPSAHGDLRSSPLSPAASIPDHPDRRPSRRRLSVRRSRPENTVRRLPARLLLARGDQTCGTSSAAHRKDRTIRSPDRAPDTAHHSQIPRSALPPPSLRRIPPRRAHRFSRCRETPPPTAESNLAPAREYGPPEAGPPLRGQPARAATGSHPVDGWQTHPRSTACNPYDTPTTRRYAAQHRPEQHPRSESAPNPQPAIAAKTCRKHTASPEPRRVDAITNKNGGANVEKCCRIGEFTSPPATR